MKLLLSMLISSMLWTGASIFTAQRTLGQEPQTAEQELIALSTQWMEAVERKDGPALEMILADGFYLSKPGDPVFKVERAEWLKGAFDRDWHDFQYHNFRVDIYGDTAVVTALLDSHIQSKWGFSYGSDAQVTDIWVKRNGKWQVAARHMGAYSFQAWLRLIAGFVAGLVFCFIVSLLLKLKRRISIGRRPPPTPSLS